MRLGWMWQRLNFSGEIPSVGTPFPAGGRLVQMCGGGFCKKMTMHCFSNSFSWRIISLISSTSFAFPCLEMSKKACEAGYAQRLKISAMWFSLPGIYPTVMSYLDKIWCQRARLPIGPLGGSNTSLAQLSSA